MSLISLLQAAAPTFDPEAATRAYLATLNGAARARSDAYFEGGYWLGLWSSLVGIASYLLMLYFGWSATWSGWATRVTKRRWLQPALYSLPFGIVGTLLALPWTIYEGFIREKQYGLMNQSFPAWAGEQGMHERARFVARSRMHDHSRRFVHDEQIVRLVDDTGRIRQFQRFSGKVGARH